MKVEHLRMRDVVRPSDTTATPLSSPHIVHGFTDKSQYDIVCVTLDYGTAGDNQRLSPTVVFESLVDGADGRRDLGVFVKHVDGFDAVGTAGGDDEGRPEVADKVVKMNGLNVATVSNRQVMLWLRQARNRGNVVHLELARTNDVDARVWLYLALIE